MRGFGTNQGSDGVKKIVVLDDVICTWLPGGLARRVGGSPPQPPQRAQRAQPRRARRPREAAAAALSAAATIGLHQGTGLQEQEAQEAQQRIGKEEKDMYT